MRNIKMVHVLGLALIFFTTLPIVGQYRTTALNLINQAAKLGPPDGMNLLINTNSSHGAHGCAVKESEKDPASAATILIAIAERLIIFANTTTEKRIPENPRDPIQPRRYVYWMQAIFELDLADRYIRKVSETNLQQAANLAIRIATLYYNSIPTNNNYQQMQNNYRAKARYHLYDINIHSAHGYARKIKDKAQQTALMNQIKGLHQAWKL